MHNNNVRVLFIVKGLRPTDGVPDMTVISNIDEHGINKNLQVRYSRDSIYVSTHHMHESHSLPSNSIQ